MDTRGSAGRIGSSTDVRRFSEKVNGGTQGEAEVWVVGWAMWSEGKEKKRRRRLGSGNHESKVIPYVSVFLRFVLVRYTEITIPRAEAAQAYVTLEFGFQ